MANGQTDNGTLTWLPGSPAESDMFKFSVLPIWKSLLARHINGAENGNSREHILHSPNLTRLNDSLSLR